MLNSPFLRLFPIKEGFFIKYFFAIFSTFVWLAHFYLISFTSVGTV